MMIKNQDILTDRRTGRQLLLLVFYIGVLQFTVSSQSNYQVIQSRIAEVKSKDLLNIIDSIMKTEKRCYYYNDSTMFFISFYHFTNFTEIQITTADNCLFDSLSSTFHYNNHLFQIDSDSSSILDSGLYSVSNYKMAYSIDYNRWLKIANIDDDTRSVYIFELRNGVFIRKEAYLCE